MMPDHGIAWMISGARREDLDRELVESALRREPRAIVAMFSPVQRPSLATRLAGLVGTSPAVPATPGCCPA